MINQARLVNWMCTRKAARSARPAVSTSPHIAIALVMASVQCVPDTVAGNDCSKVLTCSRYSGGDACQTFLASIQWAADALPSRTAARWSHEAGALVEVPVTHFWQASNVQQILSSLMTAASGPYAACTLVEMPGQTLLASVQSATEIVITDDCSDVVTRSGCPYEKACQTLMASVQW